jgi:hypothetical protein
MSSSIRADVPMLPPENEELAEEGEDNDLEELFDCEKTKIKVEHLRLSTK